jgi:hypothetical protein
MPLSRLEVFCTVACLDILEANFGTDEDLCIVYAVLKRIKKGA